MQKIKCVSKLFKHLFQVVFIIFILFNVVAWIIAPEPFLFLGKTMGFKFLVIPEQVPIMHSLSGMEKFSGFLISLVPLAVQLYLLANLVKLFALYEKGKIFVLESVNTIKCIGLALFISQIIAPFYEAALSPVLTWHNPPGNRMAIASFDGTNVGLIIAAVIILLVSWVMAEACKLKQESELTV